MNNWGKDHWSVFVYIEDLAVNGRGFAVPDHRRMRTIQKKHPGMGNHLDASEFPTILKKGKIKNHDDWDCVEDIISAGLLMNEGTGINPVYKLTERGKEIASQLRIHKQEGKNFGEFEVKE